MDGLARRRRKGFTLVEVIVALAILLILAAVAIPQLAGYLDQRRIAAAAEQLATVRDALFTTGAQSIAFRQNVRANAGRLSHLVVPISPTDRDSCNAIYSNQERSDWADAGPYLNFVIDPVAGMATPIGQASDALVRVPAIPSNAVTNRLRIQWLNASLSDAEALDSYVDLTAGWNAGTVQWTPQAGTNGLVTLFYDVVIDATC